MTRSSSTEALSKKQASLLEGTMCTESFPLPLSRNFHINFQLLTHFLLLREESPSYILLPLNKLVLDMFKGGHEKSYQIRNKIHFSPLSHSTIDQET